MAVPEPDILNVQFGAHTLWQMSEHARDHGEKKKFSAGAELGERQESNYPDNCSYSPEGWWSPCCEDHDACYGEGGYGFERRLCDQKLRDCINGKYGPGWTYYIAVRNLGCPFFRWLGMYRECGFLCLQECCGVPY